MVLKNFQQRPIFVHSKCTGLYEIGKNCPIYANSDAYQTHGSTREHTGTHMSTHERMVETTNFQQSPSQLNNKLTNVYAPTLWFYCCWFYLFCAVAATEIFWVKTVDLLQYQLSERIFELLWLGVHQLFLPLIWCIYTVHYLLVLYLEVLNTLLSGGGMVPRHHLG